MPLDDSRRQFLQQTLLGSLLTLGPKPADAFRLKEASIREMLTPQVIVEDGPGYSISWALGWQITKTIDFGVVVSHGGDQTGFARRVHAAANASPNASCQSPVSPLAAIFRTSVLSL